MPSSPASSRASRLEDALAGADYVQESAPERVEIKRELYKRLDAIGARPKRSWRARPPGLPASAFTKGWHERAALPRRPSDQPAAPDPAGRDRPGAMDGCRQASNARQHLMRRVGQSPIRLRREINGFVVNRLQSALLGEAFRLVEDGIVDADEVDRAVSDGLGLRWCFMGPFQTIDLNAKTGVAEYCRNLGADVLRSCQGTGRPASLGAGARRNGRARLAQRDTGRRPAVATAVAGPVLGQAWAVQAPTGLITSAEPDLHRRHRAGSPTSFDRDADAVDDHRPGRADFTVVSTALLHRMA